MAGGGAYYFAKKQINADRADRYSKERLKQERLRRLESSKILSGDSTIPKPKKTSHDPQSLDPSHAASADPAPVEHASESAGQGTREKSKYEAAEPFRSKKGDRFS